MVRNETKPKDADILFSFLIEYNNSSIFQKVSNGIGGIADNVERLVGDSALLVEAERYCSGKFLNATAQEELGKLFILLDICRLESKDREKYLKQLCKSFYSHLSKHVYFALRKYKAKIFDNGAAVKEAFCRESRLWWPSECESGEPDMPHDTYFLRQANLYVDISNHAKNWIVPDNTLYGLKFEIDKSRQGVLGNSLDDTRQYLINIHSCLELGLFRPEVLQAINNVFKEFSINERTGVADLSKKLDRTSSDIEKCFGISQRAFEESPFCSWPLYWISCKR